MLFACHSPTLAQACPPGGQPRPAHQACHDRPLVVRRVVGSGLLLRTEVPGLVHQQRMGDRLGHVYGSAPIPAATPIFRYSVAQIKKLLRKAAHYVTIIEQRAYLFAPFFRSTTQLAF